MLECPFSEEAQKVLTEGALSFSSWFTWVCPWSMEKEIQRPGRLLWLSIVGVPLHVWSRDTFTAIANVFGRVLEVEDWTEEKHQTYIGIVLILSNSEHSIRESICLSADGRSFTVSVAEDVADFGPRYELEDSRSLKSADEGSGCGNGECDGLPDDSKVEETMAGSVEKVKSLSERQLEIVNALITSSQAKCPRKPLNVLMICQMSSQATTTIATPSSSNL